MNNFELHKTATNMVDVYTPYQLAKKVLMLEEELQKQCKEMASKREDD
jgi:hypothetical protein